MREKDSPPNCAGKVLPTPKISIMVPAVATCIGGNVRLGSCTVPTAPSHPWVASHWQALEGSSTWCSCSQMTREQGKLVFELYLSHPLS